MPQLLVFAPVMRIIVDDQLNSLSLVDLLETVIAEVPEDIEVPADAMGATKWGAIAIWLRLAEDEGKTFEQKMELILSDGQMSSTGTIQFQMTTRFHRNRLDVIGFPLGSQGECWLKLYVRGTSSEDNEENWV